MGQAELIQRIESQLSKAAVQAGVQVLHDSGFLEYESLSDGSLVKSIFSVMLQEAMLAPSMHEPLSLLDQTR